MAYLTPSCRGASLLTGNLQLIIPFQKRVPVGMSTESLPISSFHSSSFTAPFFLVLGLYELDFSLNSRSQTAFISPLSAFLLGWIKYIPDSTDHHQEPDMQE